MHLLEYSNTNEMYSFDNLYW